jgi:tetratricopeptide (TPR) repeat protein
LAYKIRSRLHRAAGETLEAMSTDLDADSPTLALHFWRAGDAERTWKYAQMAGELARESYANVDAAAQYERALEVSRRVPGITDDQRAGLWALLGDLRELTGVLDGSVDAYRRAAALTTDPVAKADYMARRARVHSRAGAPGTALRTVAAARALAGQAPGDAARRVEARLDYITAVARLMQEKTGEGREWAERAVANARQIDDWHTLVRALNAIDFADQQLGRSGVGAHTREALEISMAQGDAPQESVARANLGVLAFYAGRWAEAVEWLTTSSRVAIEAGNDFGAAETDLTYADILIHQGRLDEAQDVLSRASRVLRASGIEDFAAHAQVLQARIHLARGRLVEAEQSAEEAAAEFVDMGSPVDALEAVLVRAEAMTSAGRPGEALDAVEAARVAAEGEAVSLEARCQVVRARAMLDLGQLDAAGDAIGAGLTAADDQELPYERATLLRLRARWRDKLGGSGAAGLARADEEEASGLLRGLGAD